MLHKKIPYTSYEIYFRTMFQKSMHTKTTEHTEENSVEIYTQFKPPDGQKTQEIRVYNKVNKKMKRVREGVKS